MEFSLEALLLLLPYLLAAFMWIMAIDYLILIPQRTQKALGTVVDYKSRWNDTTGSSGRNAVYACVVEYSVNNKTYKATNDMWSTQKPFEIGDSVPIHYLPGYEDKAYIPSKLRPLFIVLACLLSFSGLYFVIQSQGISIPGVILFFIVSILLWIGVLKRMKNSKKN